MYGNDSKVGLNNGQPSPMPRHLETAKNMAGAILNEFQEEEQNEILKELYSFVKQARMQQIDDRRQAISKLEELFKLGFSS